ncbi:MAG TPA: hypothetical protein VM535_00615 [Candidatus Saccharimonadales bacterium]|nr:hypothetical protein [Candidatus Saccharimonadales bacterium]
MLVVSFFSWWYGRGWREVMTSIGPRLKGVAETFSVAQLLRTLFQPWRRIMTYPGASLAEKFHAWADNVFSRAVGFVVRVLVLFTAVIVMLLAAVWSIVQVVVWPLLPPAVPVLIVMGLL